MKAYPLKFKPIFKERIWGGQEIRNYFGKDTPTDLKIGESWELSDLPDDKSVITNGPLTGKNISELLQEFPEEYTGDKNYAGPFPLLIKILDAQQDLSVQVHPDRETCDRTGKGDPKTECWYIVSKKPQSVIYKGLKPGVTRETFEAAIKEGSCADYLEKVDVQPGECHFLPSGTAHAIGAGLLIAEIQQPSDTTYRVFDWNRVDSKTGEPRELHIKDALESIHFDSSKDNLTVRSTGRLVDAPEFKVDKMQLDASREHNLKKQQLQVLVFLAGKGKIISSDADIDAVEYSKGNTLLTPHSYEGKIAAEMETEFLIVTI